MSVRARALVSSSNQHHHLGTRAQPRPGQDDEDELCEKLVLLAVCDELEELVVVELAVVVEACDAVKLRDVVEACDAVEA